jgi:hypothetical protein
MMKETDPLSETLSAEKLKTGYKVRNDKNIQVVCFG